MTPHAAQRIRFGILTARHEHEPLRLTDDQADYLEGCELVGWRKGDSVRAYRRERDAAAGRVSEPRRDGRELD